MLEFGYRLYRKKLICLNAWLYDKAKHSNIFIDKAFIYKEHAKILKTSKSFQTVIVDERIRFKKCLYFVSFLYLCLYFLLYQIGLRKGGIVIFCKMS